MLNKNVINVAKFSFIKSLKSKIFIIFNVIIFLCILVAFNFNTVKDIFKKNDINIGTKYNIEIEDDKGIFYDKINEISKNYTNIASIKKVEKLEEYNLENIEKDKVAIKIKYNDDYFSIDLISKEKIDSKLYDGILNLANEEKNKALVEKYNISDIDASLYENDIKINRVILDEESVVEENNTMLTFAMTMIIYFLVIFGTNAVASQIANEKTSKSAEYIFSSIPAKDYLNGKVIGANLKTLISMLFMIFYILISLTVNSLIVKTFNVNQNLNETLTNAVESTPITAGNDMDLSSVSFGFDSKVVTYIALNFVFILLTSILLSYIQAGITAKVKSISDIDSSQSISLTIIIIAYFLAFSITGINNVFTKIIANIPIFSMFLMPVNYLNDVASIWNVAISILVLIVAIFLVMHYVSKNFKKNILDIYNKNSKHKNDDVKVEETEEEKQRNIIRKKDINSLGIVISISLISLILVQAILGMVLSLIMPNLSANVYNILLSLIFVISMIIPIAIMNIFIEKNKISLKQNNKETRIKYQTPKLFLIGMAFIFAIQWLGEIIISKLGITSDLLTNSTIYEKTPLGILLLVIQMAVLPAIFEELFFRKAMLNSCRKYGDKFAIVISALAFSLIHLNLSQSIVAFFIGLVFAYITIKNENIKTNIALHFVNNLIATLTYIFSENVMVCNVINIAYIALAIIGGLVFIYTIIKDKKKLTLQGNTKNSGVKIKDMIFNYYSIILFIFIIVMMVITY